MKLMAQQNYRNHLLKSFDFVNEIQKILYYKYEEAMKLSPKRSDFATVSFAKLDQKFELKNQRTDQNLAKHEP